MNTKLKILYVDDEPINLQLFDINFSNKYEVFTALNAYIGLDILANELDISIIMSDMKMPGLNGIDFIKKAKEKFPHKRCYLLTGFEITPEINVAIESKLIVKYFRKPFNFKQIEAEFDEGL